MAGGEDISRRACVRVAPGAEFGRVAAAVPAGSWVRACGTDDAGRVCLYVHGPALPAVEPGAVNPFIDVE